jgi:hypothetical protein
VIGAQSLLGCLAIGWKRFGWKQVGLPDPNRAAQPCEMGAQPSFIKNSGRLPRGFSNGLFSILNESRTGVAQGEKGRQGAKALSAVAPCRETHENKKGTGY